MSIQLVAALTFAAISTLAHAETQTWNFNYQGLYRTHIEGTEGNLEETLNRWDPDASISGHFSADDRNHDGIISRDEVSSLTMGWQDYATCQPSDYYSCGIGNFSYSAAGGLQFDVGSFNTDPEGIVWGYASFHTNQGWYTEQHHFMWIEQSRDQVTAQTVFSISSPVPEAQTWGMMLTGLFGLAAWQRRRQARLVAASA